MRALKVTYRAVFRQPLGALNKLGVRLACDIPVEIYQSVDKWIARRPGTRSDFVEIPAAMSQESMKTSVQQSFETQVSEWQMYKPDGEVVQPGETKVNGNGTVMLLEPEDFTHIQHPDPACAPENKKLARARCGGTFKHQAFASTLENAPPPTCAICLASLKELRESRL